MKRAKRNKSDIPGGVGLLISDVVENLSRKGYGITAQQIREYETRDGLFKSIRTKGNYREYTPILIDMIAFIKRLEIIGFSKKRIKDFFSFRKQIESHPLVIANQEWDEALGVYAFTLKRSAEAHKGSTGYLKLQMLINRYVGLCEEIRERFESTGKIMGVGIQDIDSQKKSIEGILK